MAEGTLELLEVTHKVCMGVQGAYWLAMPRLRTSAAVAPARRHSTAQV